MKWECSNGLEIYSPISPDGKYTADIEPSRIKWHASQADGQIWVIKKLAEVGKMFHQNEH